MRETIETSETITVPKKIVKIYCDDCGIETPIGLRNHCELCGKDLCNKCATHDRWEGDDMVCRCNDCIPIAKTYQPEIDRLESMISDLIDKRDEECYNYFKNRTNEK